MTRPVELIAGADNSAIADWLEHSLRTALAGSDGTVAVTVPGGSTPFPILADLVTCGLDFSRLAVWPNDDRIVPEDHEASNTGKLRALAVTSEQRLASYPNVPTLKEQGVDIAVNFWSGLLAPAATPAPVVARLQQEMARIMALPDVVDRLGKLNIRPIGGSSADFKRTIAQEIDMWTQVARANDIKIN